MAQASSLGVLIHANSKTMFPHQSFRARLLVQETCRFARKWLPSLHVGGRAVAHSNFHLSKLSEAGRGHCSDMSALVAESGDLLHVVKKKNQDLRVLLRTVKWPRLMSVVVQGKTYNLPFRGTASLTRDWASCTEERLRYLAGFFDGDGCVQNQSCLSGCNLTVTQSIKQIDVLLLFLDVFGGRLTRHADGAGLCHPSLRWQVSGTDACCAARLLARYSITKRRQLEIVADWPMDRPGRVCGREDLKSLKQYDSAVSAECTLEYCTGFFDAEGHVQHRGGAQLCLHIHQKFVTVLECVHDCLLNQVGVAAQLRRANDALFHLYVSRAPACKEVLQEMIRAGLLCKAEQARLAIGLTLENCVEVRAGLARCVGNQQFGKKFNEDGMKRARNISVMRMHAARLRQCGELTKAEAKLHEIHVLKEEHKLLNAYHENKELHDYMCVLRGRLGKDPARFAQNKQVLGFAKHGAGLGVWHSDPKKTCHRGLRPQRLREASRCPLECWSSPRN